ncbi:hypothetical protein [Orrella dioscoreae]|uniref:hypothetical protein n=1 Tax=Orrella dioscoreae TaxID=1851544 RepID=UPI00082B1717|nr:hypothetical protein [Orrella dioscoreae]
MQDVSLSAAKVPQHVARFGKSIAAWSAALIALFVFSFPILPYLEAGSDYPAHIHYAKSIHQLSDITSPHFLFQLLLIGGTSLTGFSYEHITIAVLALCYAAMAGVIALRIRDTPGRHGIVMTVTLAVMVLIASHVFLQTLLKTNFYLGYIAPTVYHNPTQIILKVFSVTIMLAYFMIGFRSKGTLFWYVLLPASILLSAISKPSFLIAFLPCAMAVELYRYFLGQRGAALRNMALIAMPATIVLAFQFTMTYGSASETGIGFAPFLVYGGAAEVLSKLPGSLLFPVITAYIIWRQGVAPSELKFAWFLYAFGMIVSICLVETGHQQPAGNFAWTGQAVTFMLYVESMIALLAVPTRRAWPAWAAFALHVAFGVILYSAGFVFAPRSFW